MIVEVRVLYPMPEEEASWGSRWRYATCEVEIAETDDVAPAFAQTVYGARSEWLAHEGRLMRRDTLLDVRAGAPPVLHFSSVGQQAWGQAFAEEADDVARSRGMRDKAVEAAKRWLGEALIAREQGEQVLLVPAPEPLIVVLPPGDRTPMWSFSRPNKVPVLNTVVEAHYVAPKYAAAFAEALRTDRLFRIDELDGAAARAREFGPRIHRRYHPIEIHGGRWSGVDLSARALKLVCAEAVYMAEAFRIAGDLAAAEVAAAGRALQVAVADEGANAAAICPHARSFLAAFESSPQALRLSQQGDMATALARVRRAHDRAQMRMAAGTIPDRDPRALAPEDDIAMGRLGP